MKALALVALLALPASADDLTVVETSVLVAAPVEQVWAALSTAPGLESWMTGRAKVDLRVGGEVLTRYAKAGAFPDGETIVHTITALDPQHVLVWKPKRAPSKFPFKEAWLKTTDFLTLRPDRVTLEALQKRFAAPPKP